MRTKLTYKLIISLILTIFSVNFASADTFASLAPSLTEIFYAIGAQDSLVAVSTECKFPLDAQKKEKIGNTFFLDREKLLKLSPDYLLAVESAQFRNFKLPKSGIKPVCFTMNSVNAVFEAILQIGKLTGKYKDSLQLVKKMSCEIDNITPKKQLRILYLVQLNPLITIGRSSYISDVIRKSGHISVTDEIQNPYPSVSYEYIVKSCPDVIVVFYKSENDRLRQFFPDKRIIYLSEKEQNIINLPGIRTVEAVKFFSGLKEM